MTRLTIPSLYYTLYIRSEKYEPEMIGIYDNLF